VSLARGGGDQKLFRRKRPGRRAGENRGKKAERLKYWNTEMDATGNQAQSR